MSDMDLKDVLLRTTARLFQERGYAAVTLRSIAAEAGVTTGSLYHYFRDKEEIVLEILDIGHKGVYEEVERAIASLPPDADRFTTIRTGVRAHITALFEPGSFAAANIRIYAHVPPHLRDAVRPGRRAYENFWIKLLSGPVAQSTAIPARHLAMFFFGAANWTFEWFRPERETLDQVADNLASLLLGNAVERPQTGRVAG